MRVRLLLLSGLVIWLQLCPLSVQAQAQAQGETLSSLDKVDQLQRKLDQLQQQMKALKNEMAAAKKKPADADVWQNSYGADLGKSKLVKAMPFLEQVHVTLGGFFGAETIWRQHNMTADESDAWAAIPFPFQPTYGEREFRASGRASRFTILTEGNIDPKRKLSGYVETDFYGAGVTSNYNQSNSWAARPAKRILCRSSTTITLLASSTPATGSYGLSKSSGRCGRQAFR
jgi:hypothetical protein